MPALLGSYASHGEAELHFYPFETTSSICAVTRKIISFLQGSQSLNSKSNSLCTCLTENSDPFRSALICSLTSSGLDAACATEILTSPRRCLLSQSAGKYHVPALILFKTKCLNQSVSQLQGTVEREKMQETFSQWKSNPMARNVWSGKHRRFINGVH